MGEVLMIVFWILVAGVFVWAIGAAPGIDPTFKQWAKIVVIVVLVLWCLNLLYGMATGQRLLLR